jgi:anti-anti-sigma factor
MPEPSAPLHVEVRKSGDVVIVDVEGKLAAGFGDVLLRDTLDELFGEGWKKVLLNLTRVSFIDSAGLGELVAGLRRARRQAVALKVLNTAGKVQEALFLARLLPMFDMYADERSALAAF